MSAIYCDCGDVLIEDSGAKCANCIASETSRTRLLISALYEYIELLGAEINDLASFAHVYGITSTRIEQGKELRDRIARLRVSDRSENPAGGTPRNCSEERGPRNEGDAHQH